MRVSFTSAARLTLPLVGIVAIAVLWSAWCEFTFYAWNEMRLAPAFALRHGINPYPPIAGGPLSTWIYGPVGIVVNLPATFASSAENALHVFSIINALIVLGPMAVIFFSSAKLRARDPALPWLAFALGLLLVPGLNLVLPTADHSATSLGLLSCWYLARSSRPDNRRLAFAATLCALAIWSKQITLFLLPAQCGFFLVRRERTLAVRYVLWVAFWGALALALFAAAFGFSNLWLNLVAIPGRLPWAEIGPRLALRRWPLVAQVVIPSIALLVLWRKKLWPRQNDESSRLFQVAAFAYIAMLPVGLVAFLKIGGDTNLLHSWDYLMPAMLLVWLTTDRPTLATPASLLLAALGVMILQWPKLVSLPAQPSTAHLEAAAVLTATYPHRIWFPQNPVITFYADRRLWHTEDGIFTRDCAGYGLREPDFRRHLPAPLQAVAYPAIVGSTNILALLPELSCHVRQRHWVLHTQPSPPPSSQ